MFKPTNFNFLPQVIKHLIIINILVFIGQNSIGYSKSLKIAGLFPFSSDMFQPFQIITHMFMHGSLSHIFFNMFALWMFGNMIENVWGSKRFLIYYVICGLGAVFCHQIVQEIYISSMSVQEAFYAKQIPTVGASGAVFGILLAFGMLFPNTKIYLYLLFPIKAKYFVIIYGIIELWSGLLVNDNIAHFAHLGGMIFGFFVIKHWRKNRRNFF